MPHRIVPLGRFEVESRVLDLDRLPEVVGARVEVAAASGDLAGQRVHGDRERRLAIGPFGRRGVDRRHRVERGLRLRPLSLGGVRHAAGVVRHGVREADVRRRKRFGQHVVPFSERRERERVVRQHLLQHPDLARGVEVHLGGECIGRLDRLRTAARHRGGESEEVDVVRVVRQRIDAHRVLPFDEHLVGMDGVLVGLHGVVPPSDSDVDVCGHVDHMPFARHEISEPLRAWHRGLRVHRFDRVDVVVARAGVVRVARNDFWSWRTISLVPG